MHRPANHPDWGITIANLSNGEYFLIRVPAIKRSGEQYTLYASLAVKKCGGKRAAKQAAREQRDKFMATQDGKRYLQTRDIRGKTKVRKEPEKGTSVPGITGVHIVVAETAGNRKYIAIAGQVGAFGGNDYARKTFSCRKHGIEGALRKALKYRIDSAGRGSMPKQETIDAAVMAIRGRIKQVDRQFEEEGF